VTEINHLLEFCIVLYYYLYAKNILKLLLYKELKNVSLCVYVCVGARVSVLQKWLYENVVLDVRQIRAISCRENLFGAAQKHILMDLFLINGIK